MESQGAVVGECRCLSVVMPVYNEEATLKEIVGKVLRIPHLLELIIVDDGSSDNTGQIARALSELHECIRHLPLNRNLGKTAALEAGFPLTKGQIVVVQDGDLEYDPTEIAGLIAPILEGHADVVVGSRFMVRKAARVLYFTHYVANRFLTLFSNCLTNLNMTDVETCYKAFRGDIARSMIIRSRGFGFEVESIAKVAKLGCAIYEVPISYYGRTYAEGKKIGLWDGLAAFVYIAKFNWFTTLRKSFRTLPAPRTGEGQSLALEPND